MTAAFSQVLPKPFESIVTSVSDGDTFRVRLNNVSTIIRLYGVDAPESSQPYGAASTLYLRTLIAGRTVSLIPHDRDRYGRLVCDAFSEDERRVSTASVAQGMSWWYTFYAPNDSQLAAAQARAQSNHRGLWQDQNPIPPWVYRCRRVVFYLSPNATVRRPLASPKFHRPGCNRVYYPWTSSTKHDEIEADHRPCELCRP